MLEIAAIILFAMLFEVFMAAIVAIAAYGQSLKTRIKARVPVFPKISFK